MAKEKTVYIYTGPVMHYDLPVECNWKAATLAVSEKQARSNIAYQFRSKHGFVPSYHIALPGKLEVRA